MNHPQALACGALLAVAAVDSWAVTIKTVRTVDYLLNKSVAILRTDLNDSKCPVDDRMGRNSTPGGCTNYVLNW